MELHIIAVFLFHSLGGGEQLVHALFVHDTPHKKEAHQSVLRIGLIRIILQIDAGAVKHNITSVRNHTGFHEGMSNVLLEAAASGRPLITSNIPGCREAVEDGVSGYLCPTKDADALFDTMHRFAELPRDCRNEMGHLGRQRMEEQFSKTVVVAKTIEELGL